MERQQNQEKQQITEEARRKSRKIQDTRMATIRTRAHLVCFLPPTPHQPPGTTPPLPPPCLRHTMAQQQDHPVFDDIEDGNLEEVQRRVRADAAVLEERLEEYGATPLM